MKIEELLSNFTGRALIVDAVDNGTVAEVMFADKGNLLLPFIKDLEVVNWGAAVSSTNPKVRVVCNFEIEETPSEDEEPDTEVEEGTTNE